MPIKENLTVEMQLNPNNQQMQGRNYLSGTTSKLERPMNDQLGSEEHNHVDIRYLKTPQFYINYLCRVQKAILRV